MLLNRATIKVKVHGQNGLMLLVAAFNSLCANNSIICRDRMHFAPDALPPVLFYFSQLHNFIINIRYTLFI